MNGMNELLRCGRDRDNEGITWLTRIWRRSRAWCCCRAARRWSRRAGPAAAAWSPASAASSPASTCRRPPPPQTVATVPLPLAARRGLSLSSVCCVWNQRSFGASGEEMTIERGQTGLSAGFSDEWGRVGGGRCAYAWEKLTGKKGEF